MTRRLKLAAAAVAVLLSQAPGGAAGKTATFDVTAVHKGPQSNVTQHSKVWVTERQARADVSNPLQGTIRFLVSGNHLYQIDMKGKRYLRAPLPPEMAASKDNFKNLVARFAFDPGDALDKARTLRTERIAGQPCRVMVATRKEGDTTRKLTAWMPTAMKWDFPLKVVMQDQVKKKGASVNRTVTISFANLRLNKPIPASIFAVPAGFKEVKPKPQPQPQGAPPAR